MTVLCLVENAKNLQALVREVKEQRGKNETKIKYIPPPIKEQVVKKYAAV